MGMGIDGIYSGCVFACGEKKPTNSYMLPKPIYCRFLDYQMLELIDQHLKSFAEFPWKHVNSLSGQWKVMPTFLMCEFLLYFASLCCLIHALQPILLPSSKIERRYFLIWVASIVAGVANDYFFMLLPLVDSFWHAQAWIMITPRLPLYILCVYNCTMYLGYIGALRFHLKSLFGEAAIAALLSALFYAPFDACGARFLWWTWHDSDASISGRWLYVPIGSTLWILTFNFAFGLLLRWTRKLNGFLSFAALILFTTPLMLAIMTVLPLLAMDGIGVPNKNTLVLTLVLFSLLALKGIVTNDSRAMDDSVRTRKSTILQMGVLVFLTGMMAIALLGKPEEHISTGIHQTHGPCNITDMDLNGNVRSIYICRRQYDEPFSFDCGNYSDEGSKEVLTESDLHRWYTVCGLKYDNFSVFTAVVLALSVSGILVFAFVFGGLKKQKKTKAD